MHVWKLSFLTGLLLALCLAACSPQTAQPGKGTGTETPGAAATWNPTQEGSPVSTGTGPTGSTSTPDGVGLPGTGGQTPGAAGTPGASQGSYSQAVREAQRRLSQKLNVPIAQVEVISAQHVQWRDACLGLAGPNEMCAQVITPGWRIVLRANGQEYDVRTDELGTQVRWVSKPENS